jgi:hypothetical protein
MNLRNLVIALALGASMLMGSAVAQSTPAPTSGSTGSTNTSGAGPGVVDPNHPRVNQINRREQRQQNRIANGIKSGQLTPGETARLEGRENRLVQNEKRDMAKDNGHLTKKNQAQLNREANRVSRGIYKDKHNSAKQ